MEKISIIIIAYNSEKWIEETLESVKDQTFENLELIISDDSSEDKTLEICKKWINKNKSRFNNIKILNSKKNMGIVKNINKAIKITTGNWIKIIAADDILMKNCIEKNIIHSIDNNYEILFSKMLSFRDTVKGREHIDDKNNLIEKFFSKDSQRQFKELIFENKISAPTAFFNKKIFEKYGYFDEMYPNVEDYPMWLKLTKNGVRLNYMDEITVKYRIHNKSLSNTENIIINERIFKFRKEIYDTFLSKEVKSSLFHYSEKLKRIRCENILKKGNKKKTWITYLTYIIDPYTYIKLLRKIIK